MKRATYAAFVVLLIPLTACGDATTPETSGPAGATADPSPDTVGTSAEDIAEQARAVPGVDEVRLDYLDPDGEPQDKLPTKPAERTGWVAQVGIVHDLRIGAGRATEIVADLVSDQPLAATPTLEIWLRPTAEAEVAALAYPSVDDGERGPVRDAYLMANTPGVVRSVFDGTTADVRVRDESNLAKVADVAAAHDVHVDQIRTADDAAALDISAVPPRPAPVTVALPWPDDPTAPACPASSLRLSIAGSDAATGHRFLTLAATNTGAEPCAVVGYPELGFHTRDEQNLDVTVTHGRPSMVSDPGVHRVVIPAGARAIAITGWSAMPTAEYPEGSGHWPDLAAEVVLAVSSGAGSAELPLTSFALDPTEADHADLSTWEPMSTLDIVDGGEVTVTAWAPDGTEF